jgi:drug/metabolite transporter (DMT)-like permease
LIERLGAVFWRNAWLLLTCTALFWAGNAVVGRAVAGAVPPVTLAFWRWTGAFVFVLGFAWPHLRRDKKTLLRQWRMMLVLSATGIACFNVMLYTGLKTTTALNGVLAQSSMPLIVILWAIVLLKEKPTMRQMAGVLVSLIGVAAIAAHGSMEALLLLSFNTGDLWILGGMVIYSFYTALLRRRPAVHPLSFLAVTFFMGALMLLPLYLWERGSGQFITGGAESYLAIFYTMVFPSLLAYLCFNRGVELIGPGHAGQSSHLVPVFGVLLAVVFLGETFYPYHAAGVALITVGILLASLAPGRALWPAVTSWLHRART